MTLRRDLLHRKGLNCVGSPMGFASFRTTVRRHGLALATLRSAVGVARRLIDFETCHLVRSSDAPYAWPDIVDYETRIVYSTEFHSALCDELATVDYRWAFARGDTCVASFRGAELVGYTFYSALPTRVRDGIEFAFPSTYVYSFAAATAPSHRGHRLEPERWKVARRHRNAMGADPPAIGYVNVANLESLAANKASSPPSTFLGYIAYAKVNGRFRFFASRGARTVGAEFRAPGSVNVLPDPRSV